MTQISKLTRSSFLYINQVHVDRRRTSDYERDVETVEQCQEQHRDHGRGARRHLSMCRLAAAAISPWITPPCHRRRPRLKPHRARLIPRPNRTALAEVPNAHPHAAPFRPRRRAAARLRRRRSHPQQGQRNRLATTEAVDDASAQTDAMRALDPSLSLKGEITRSCPNRCPALTPAGQNVLRKRLPHGQQVGKLCAPIYEHQPTGF